AQDIAGSSEGGARPPEKDCRRAKPEEIGQQIIQSAGGSDARKGKQIRGCDHAALVLFFRAVLDQGIDWHDKKPAGKAQRGEQEQHLERRKPGNSQGETQPGHAQRAQRDETVFNLPAGKVARHTLPKPIPIATAASSGPVCELLSRKTLSP